MKQWTRGMILLCAFFCGIAALTMPSASAQTAAEPPAAPVAPEGLLPGVWRGVETSGFVTYHHRLEVKHEGQGYVADGITWAGMTEAQALSALEGKLPLTAFPDLSTNAVRPTCMRQQFTVALQGDMATFRGVRQPKIVTFRAVRFTNAAGNAGNPTSLVITRIEEGSGVEIEVAGEQGGARRLAPQEQDVFLQGFSAYKPALFVGRLTAPRIVAQDGEGSAPGTTLFRLWREDALAKPQPLTQQKGATVKLGCLDSSRYHYTCYLPKSYDPAHPTPVLINSSPSGDAQPLSEKMAESLGWIMVGLTESQNGPQIDPNCRCRDAVLFDLRRRFNIDPKRIYFAGFSGGARSASLAAFSYPESCAGLICIGASCNGATPDLSIPIYFLVGQTDMNREEAARAYAAEKKAGRKTEIVLHTGGHTWGTPEDHEAALRWLVGDGARHP